MLFRRHGRGLLASPRRSDTDVATRLIALVGLARSSDPAALSELARGSPIPAERLAVLFEPYERGAGTHVSHRSGLGLGLYIAHEIVAAHKGRLTAKSSVDGTVFTVDLPL